MCKSLPDYSCLYAVQKHLMPVLSHRLKVTRKSFYKIHCYYLLLYYSGTIKTRNKTLRSRLPVLNESILHTQSDCKIYVPYSADHSVLNAYKAANNWSTYADKMVEEAS